MLNPLRLRSVRAGLVLVAGLCLYVPWRAPNTLRPVTWTSLGYAFLWSPPDNPAVIDFGRWGLGLLVLAAIAGLSGALEVSASLRPPGEGHGVSSAPHPSKMRTLWHAAMANRWVAIWLAALLTVALAYVIFQAERGHRQTLREDEARAAEARASERPHRWPAETLGAVNVSVTTRCRGGDLLSRLEVNGPPGVLQAIRDPYSTASFTAVLSDSAGFELARVKWMASDLMAGRSPAGALNDLDGQARANCDAEHYLPAKTLHVAWSGALTELLFPQKPVLLSRTPSHDNIRNTDGSFSDLIVSQLQVTKCEKSVFPTSVDLAVYNPTRQTISRAQVRVLSTQPGGAWTREFRTPLVLSPYSTGSALIDVGSEGSGYSCTIAVAW